MLQNLITSVVAFVSTNIDDIFLLMLFYASGKFLKTHIVIGQYLGIAALVTISLIGAYIGSFFDQRYIGLLGLFPIYIAIRQTIGLFRDDDDDDEATPTSFGALAVAGVTIANGGDNIGVYIPLMTVMSVAEIIQLVVTFIVATYLLCLLGQYLANHPLIARQLAKYGHVVTPTVLFLLGVFVLIESKTFSLLE